MATQTVTRPIRITYKYLEPKARVFLIKRPHPYYVHSDAHAEYWTVPWPVRLTHGSELRFDNALVSLVDRHRIDVLPWAPLGVPDMADECFYEPVTNDYATALAGILRVPYVSIIEQDGGADNVTVYYKPSSRSG